jgi:hypothetical protein
MILAGNTTNCVWNANDSSVGVFAFWVAQALLPVCVLRRQDPKPFAQNTCKTCTIVVQISLSNPL